MNRDASPAEIALLRKLAEEKLSSIINRLSRSDYEYFLDLVMMEIAQDLRINYKAKFLLDAEAGNVSLGDLP